MLLEFHVNSWPSSLVIAPKFRVKVSSVAAANPPEPDHLMAFGQTSTRRVISPVVKMTPAFAWAAMLLSELSFVRRPCPENKIRLSSLMPSPRLASNVAPSTIVAPV